MSVREPGSLSRANGALLVVDHFLRGWGLMKKKTTTKNVPTTLPSDAIRSVFVSDGLHARFLCRPRPKGWLSR